MFRLNLMKMKKVFLFFFKGLILLLNISLPFCVQKDPMGKIYLILKNKYFSKIYFIIYSNIVTMS